jgi:hypothetical protein
MERASRYKSIRQVAASVGRSPSALHRAIQRGQVDADDLEASAVAWAAANPAPTEHRVRVDKARADLLELRVRKERGELIDRAKTNRLFFETGKAVRERLEQWPARAAAPLAAKLGRGVEPHLIENLLAEEVNGLLVGIVEQLRRDF